MGTTPLPALYQRPVLPISSTRRLVYLQNEHAGKGFYSMVAPVSSQAVVCHFLTVDAGDKVHATSGTRFHKIITRVFLLENLLSTA